MDEFDLCELSEIVHENVLPTILAKKPFLWICVGSFQSFFKEGAPSVCESSGSDMNDGAIPIGAQ